MTPEEINKAIAEDVRSYVIEDYYHDLNACAEMVNGFNLDDSRKFSDHLKVAIQRDQFINSAVDARYMTANATAPQRCEAFLRTKGLWVEQPIAERK